jgi:hypothetical protein
MIDAINGEKARLARLETQYREFKRAVLFWFRTEYGWWFDWKMKEGWRIDCKGCRPRADLCEESLERAINYLSENPLLDPIFFRPTLLGSFKKAHDIVLAERKEGNKK